MLKQPELSAEHLYFEYPPKRPDDPFSKSIRRLDSALWGFLAPRFAPQPVAAAKRAKAA